MLQPVHGAPPTRLDRLPSRFFCLYLLLVHFCMGFSLCFYPLSGWVVTGLLPLVMIHGLWSHWFFNSVTSRCWVSRLQTIGDEVYVVQAGQVIPVVIEQATLWHWLIVIRFRRRDNRRKLSVLLLPDSAEADQLRQLRLLLRHCLHAGVQDGVLG